MEEREEVMGVLDNSVAYLSGAIENARDDGVSWREDIVTKIHGLGIDLGFIDPCDKGDKLLGEIGRERALLASAKEKGNFSFVTEKMKEVRHWDLRAVDSANVMILKLDPKVPTCGTWDEVFEAEDQQIPILAIIEGGPSAAPDWLFAVMDHRMMFNSIDECVEFIKKVDEGKIKVGRKWLCLHDNIKRRELTEIA